LEDGGPYVKMGYPIFYYEKIEGVMEDMQTSSKGLMKNLVYTIFIIIRDGIV